MHSTRENQRSAQNRQQKPTSLQRPYTQIITDLPESIAV